MVNRKRAALISFLMMILVMILAVPTKAAPSQEADPLTTALVQQGFPVDLAQRLPMDIKKEIVQKRLRYVQHKSQRGNLVESNEGGLNYTPEDGNISIASLSNFYETVTFVEDPSAPSGVLRYYVYYDWQWYYQPVWTLVDKIGLAWGGDWAIDTAASPYYWSYTAHGNCCWPAQEAAYLQTGSTADNARPYGVAYAHDIVSSFSKNGNSYGVTWHEGWGRVIVRRPYPSSWGNNADNFLGQYFHAQYSCVPAISISYPASLGVASCSASTDASPSVLDTLYY